MSDDELPEILTLLPRSRRVCDNEASTTGRSLRRSPRKHSIATERATLNIVQDAPPLFVSSNQRVSPRKQDSPVRALRPTQGKPRKAILEDAPKFKVVAQQQQQRISEPVILISDDSEDDLARIPKPLRQGRSKPRHGPQERSSTIRSRISRTEPTSAMSRITQAARIDSKKTGKPVSGPTAKTKRSNPYVSTQAHCEDLNESSGTEGEEEDTDLSGFIVADDIEVSFHGSADEISSNDDWNKSRQRKQRKAQHQTGRRLVRGSRQKVPDSDDEGDLGLVNALSDLQLGEGLLEQEKNKVLRKHIDIVDLTSSPVPEERPQSKSSLFDSTQSSIVDIFGTEAPVISKLTFIPNLQPKQTENQGLIPLKSETLAHSPALSAKRQEPLSSQQPTTPPATPPRSPSKTKLKSPAKLMSPSKHGKAAPRSPNRQSMVGFWDHNAVNDWHDTYSPKKAPLISPRKNPLAKFNFRVSDNVEDDTDLDSSSHGSRSRPSSQDPFDDASDSLPSPSDSPSKSRSPSKVSALKAEQTRLKEEKKAKLAAKRAFDAQKIQMASELVSALDKHITDSKISTMSASTGGIQIIWSKTLRSTAGRANWKRTVTKPSGSPVKGTPDSQSIEKQPGVVIQHFASIELADKIIDRPGRLVNTLAHEFCHLANFMVSGIRDQPHGDSFKKWGLKVTQWLKSDNAKKAAAWREVWSEAEVTTKHTYVIETKYLWVCTGRPAAKQKQSLTMKMLNIEAEDEEGCGAEYGRHSKSIDVEKQRCGRCKGFLVQVRPTPRTVMSPRKSPVKRSVRTMNSDGLSGVDNLEMLLSNVDLSD